MAKTYIFNPLKTDFTITYDIHGTGSPVPFTIPAIDMAGFEEPVATHVLTHLSQAILNERGIKTNYDDDIANIKKEITNYGLDKLDDKQD